MLQWMVVVLVLVFAVGVFRESLARTIRLGRLPGDLNFRLKGKQYHFPFTSTVLLSLLAWIILRIV